ncbi:hypothetical protein [Actinoplanes sp. N902-109]|nr:hypothetical protein [Actinoplanes sp. N902-109]
MADPFLTTTGRTRLAAFDELAAAGPVQNRHLFTGRSAWLVIG